MVCPQLKNLIFRVHTTPLGQKVLCQPSSFSLLVAASISSSLPPGPQTALTHLLEASLHCIPSSALSSVTLPPAFDCGSTEGGVVCILLSRLANCLVPGAQGLINDNCNAQEMEGKGRKGPGANIDLEDDQMERGLVSMDEDFPEGRQENTETESSSQSVSTDTSSINVASEVVGGSPDGETESPESIPANDESLRLVDVTGLNRRLALFLHKREDESPHEVGPVALHNSIIGYYVVKKFRSNRKFNIIYPFTRTCMYPINLIF